MGKRILWALILAPPVLAAVHFGPPYSDLLVALAIAIMLWEWAHVSNQGRLDTAGYSAIAVGLGAVGLSALGTYDLAAWLLAVGTMAVLVLTMRGPRQRSLWLAAGVCYLGVACLSLQWLRQDSEAGRNLVYWLLALVWATDTAAYFAGRTIGGPKLAPAISPNKTWSGLLGGMLGAALAGFLAALLLDLYAPLPLAFASAALAVVAQAGDLLESGFKRSHGVKDSSSLIPGHGGLLDRVDGILSVVIIVAGLFWVRGGQF